MTQTAWRIMVLLMLNAVTFQLHAHTLAPSLLEIRTEGGGIYSVAWKFPVIDGNSVAIRPEFPSSCKVKHLPELTKTHEKLGSLWESRFQIDCGSETLADKKIVIAGLSAANTNVVVRYFIGQEEAAQWLLSNERVDFVLPADKNDSTIFQDYLLLGIHHLLSGFDHVLFVIGLLMLIRGGRQLLIAITAFTLGHSLTLALSALNIIQLPQPPVEILIAVTILLVAKDIQENTGKSWLREYPAIITTFFGLIHGLGFASVLGEFGLPLSSKILGLLAFNLGIEAGQLLIVIGWLVAGVILHRLKVLYVLARLEAPLVYGIGSIAAFWVIDRSCQMLMLGNA